MIAGSDPKREIGVRVLVAIEDDHRAYREAIASAIGVLRPGAEVESVGPAALEEQLESFDPQVVVCSRPEAEGAGERAAWVELSLKPMRPTKVRVGRRFSEQSNPTLEALLAVIDEATAAVGARSNR